MHVSLAVYDRCLTNHPYLDDHRAQYSLLEACFQANLVSFLSAIPPRLCKTVFYFMQPLLINTTVSYVEDDSAEISYGPALIGAWALVYLGIAVRPTWLLVHQQTNTNLYAVFNRPILVSDYAIHCQGQGRTYWSRLSTNNEDEVGRSWRYHRHSSDGYGC